MPHDANQSQSICDLTYLSEMMFGNKEMIAEIISDFTQQSSAELKLLAQSISNEDFAAIKKCAHKMMSTVGIMGISTLTPLLKEIEALGAQEKDLPRIKIIAYRVNEICLLAVRELNT